MPELTCSVCHTPLVPQHPRVRDPQSQQCFAILACPSCGLGATTPQPADLGAYYGPSYYGNRHGFTARLSTMVSFQPSGTLLDGHGVTPDEVVPPGVADFTSGTDAMLERAIELLSATGRRVGPSPDAKP